MDTRIQPNTPIWHPVPHRIVRSNSWHPVSHRPSRSKVGTQYLIESIRRNIVTPSVSSTRGRSIPEHFQSYGMPTISDSARLVNRVFNSLSQSYITFNSQFKSPIIFQSIRFSNNYIFHNSLIQFNLIQFISLSFSLNIHIDFTYLPQTHIMNFKWHHVRSGHNVWAGLRVLQ